MKGLFIGRFQPLHLGHISIIEHVVDEVEGLIVCIGSAERSFLLGDPFTAGERMEMLIRTAADRGWTGRLIPIPVRDINRYPVWVSHVVSLCPPFDIVYTNSPLTIRLFREAGYQVRSTPIVDRSLYSGENIRRLMVGGGQWRSLVPDPVAVYIDEIGGEKRLKEASGRGDWG